MKKGNLIFVSILLSCLVGCESLDPLTSTEEYQQAEQLTHSGLQVLQEKTNTLTEQAKTEAKKQYETLKNDTKTVVKDSVNQKIDETFDRF